MTTDMTPEDEKAEEKAAQARLDALLEEDAICHECQAPRTDADFVDKPDWPGDQQVLTCECGSTAFYVVRFEEER
jgi:hypothetical protein